MARAVSRGALLLREKVTPDFTQNQIASRLRVTQQAVSNWVNGIARPNPEVMAALEDLTGIPMRAWTEPGTETEAASGPDIASEPDEGAA